VDLELREVGDPVRARLGAGRAGRCRGLGACGVPEVGHGSLTSGDCRSGHDPDVSLRLLYLIFWQVLGLARLPLTVMGQHRVGRVPQQHLAVLGRRTAAIAASRPRPRVRLRRVVADDPSDTGCPVELHLRFSRRHPRSTTVTTL